MVYSFDGEFIEDGKRIFIRIPFNVWDKCGRKGNISVKVTIDDLNYECKLIPKGNGIYYIPITKEDFRKVNANDKLKITFQLISGLSRINKDSPYNLERPIRKIDSINIVTQPKKGHLMIYFEGKYYDPAIGVMEQFDSKEITGILEIFL